MGFFGESTGILVPPANQSVIERTAADWERLFAIQARQVSEGSTPSKRYSRARAVAVQWAVKQNEQPKGSPLWKLANIYRVAMLTAAESSHSRAKKLAAAVRRDIAIAAAAVTTVGIVGLPTILGGAWSAIKGVGSLAGAAVGLKPKPPSSGAGVSGNDLADDLAEMDRIATAKQESEAAGGGGIVGGLGGLLGAFFGKAAQSSAATTAAGLGAFPEGIGPTVTSALPLLLIAFAGMVGFVILIMFLKRK